MHVKTVDNEVKYAAGEAVYGLQLSYKRAVKFVVRNAKTDKKTAKEALNHVMVGYKLR